MQRSFSAFENNFSCNFNFGHRNSFAFADKNFGNHHSNFERTQSTYNLNHPTANPSPDEDSPPQPAPRTSKLNRPKPKIRKKHYFRNSNSNFIDPIDWFYHKNPQRLQNQLQFIENSCKNAIDTNSHHFGNLRLNGCGLMMIPNQIFKFLKHKRHVIQKVDISVNYLSHINPKIFTEFENLVEFRTVHNFISNLPESIENCQKLQKVEIYENDMMKLEKDEIYRKLLARGVIDQQQHNSSQNSKFEHFENFRNFKTLSCHNLKYDSQEEYSKLEREKSEAESTRLVSNEKNEPPIPTPKLRKKLKNIKNLQAKSKSYNSEEVGNFLETTLPDSTPIKKTKIIKVKLRKKYKNKDESSKVKNYRHSTQNLYGYKAFVNLSDADDEAEPAVRPSLYVKKGQKAAGLGPKSKSTLGLPPQQQEILKNSASQAKFFSQNPEPTGTPSKNRIYMTEKSRRKSLATGLKYSYSSHHAPTFSDLNAGQMWNNSTSPRGNFPESHTYVRPYSKTTFNSRTSYHCGMSGSATEQLFTRTQSSINLSKTASHKSGHNENYDHNFDLDLAKVQNLNDLLCNQRPEISTQKIEELIDLVGNTRLSQGSKSRDSSRDLLDMPILDSVVIKSGESPIKSFEDLDFPEPQPARRGNLDPEKMRNKPSMIPPSRKHMSKCEAKFYKNKLNRKNTSICQQGPNLCLSQENLQVQAEVKENACTYSTEVKSDADSGFKGDNKEECPQHSKYLSQGYSLF